MEQLILHLFGDYVTQSDWMAQNKTKSHVAAWWHALVYSLPFLLITGERAFLVILFTHFIIDRYRLARFVVYVKNRYLQPRPDFFASENGESSWALWHKKWSWENCKGTGYPADAPPWLAVWLLIAADNTLHLAINYAAIRWL